MISKFKQYLLLFILCIGHFGCEEQPSTSAVETDNTDVSPYAATAGFVHIPSREIAIDGFGFSEHGRTTAANLFYSFVPAVVSGEQKPIFVFFNGGPGAATSSALAVWGTGPAAAVPSGEVQDNVGDFSTLGNLLYIDSRQTGFSYDEVDDPSDGEARTATFGFLNYNLYTDVSDILIGLLQILEERPLLEGNPIVLVAESYGGARAAVLLSFARGGWKSGFVDGVFEDAVLSSMLDAHFTRIDENAPDVAAGRQFARQVLIQPGRVLPKRVEAAHTLYSLCNHINADDPRFEYCDGRIFDYSDIREPKGFFDRRTAIAQTLITSPAGFAQFFGSSWDTIPGLLSENRTHAFRFAEEEEVQRANIGGASLAEWDTHHITMHPTPYFSWQDEEGPYASYDAGEWAAEAFVEGLRSVHTFITDAYFDYAVDARSFPAALLAWNSLQGSPVIEAARYRADVDSAAERPGWMELTFAPEPDGAPSETRVVRMPEYTSAGHMVPMYQPADFLADVRDFLHSTELIQSDEK